MKSIIEEVYCPKCRAFGFIGTISNIEYETPEQSEDCDLCKTTGKITKRYFVEFVFAHIDKTYWLPIFFEANTSRGASIKITKFEIGLRDKYTKIELTKPILYDIENASRISAALSKYKNKKPSTLSVSTWKLKIESDDNLSFMDNIHEYPPRLIGGPTSIARQEKREYNVIRIIAEKLETSIYDDYLAIDITG